MYVCRILLKLWEEMAESNLERLKLNDFIYVAGTLESYKKANKCGKSYLCYEVGCSSIHTTLFFFNLYLKHFSYCLSCISTLGVGFFSLVLELNSCLNLGEDDLPFSILANMHWPLD